MESYGMEMNLDNSRLVACGDAVVVATACNAAAAGDVATTVGVEDADDVVVVVGATAVVVVWVQWCWMRPCTSPHSHFLSVVVTLKGNELSWWY